MLVPSQVFAPKRHSVIHLGLRITLYIFTAIIASSLEDQEKETIKKSVFEQTKACA